MPTTRSACLLVVAALVIGGCLGGAEPESVTETPADAAKPARFDEATGGLSGLVTDDEFIPLGGASIRIQEDASQSTTADSSGRFSLSYVIPGAYTLVVELAGYETAARSITITTGKITELRVEMKILPAPEPYVEVLLYQGYINCAFSVVRTTLLGKCGVVGPNDNNKDEQTIYGKGWPQTLKAIVFEADWDTRDVLAFDLKDETSQPVKYYYRLRSASPAKAIIDMCTDYRSTAYAANPMPCTPEEMNATKARFRTTYVGQFRSETSAADSFCRQNVSHPTGGNLFGKDEQGCYGVGAASDLRWTNYASLFHYEVEDDLRFYSARPDR
jgi:hypothetical protein